MFRNTLERKIIKRKLTIFITIALTHTQHLLDFSLVLLNRQAGIKHSPRPGVHKGKPEKEKPLARFQGTLLKRISIVPEKIFSRIHRN